MRLNEREQSLFLLNCLAIDFWKKVPVSLFFPPLGFYKKLGTAVQSPAQQHNQLTGEREPFDEAHISKELILQGLWLAQ